MIETKLEVDANGLFTYVVYDKRYRTVYELLGFKADGTYNIKFLERTEI